MEPSKTTSWTGGTVENLAGKVPIRESGGKITRVETEGHPPGGVSKHTYPHINYETASGAKGTIQIQPPKVQTPE